MNRLREGYCYMINPYGRQIYRISLKREDVGGFVFWTKNIGPFLKYLPEIQQRGYPFIVQHTINGYPRELEARVINYEQTVEHMRQLAERYGLECLVWRYDPIIFSSLIPVKWHQENFAKLARKLEGVTDEVVISFAQIYRKTLRNMEAAALEYGFQWHEHKDEQFVLQTGRLLVKEFAQIAHAHRMRLKICSQKAFLVEDVVEEARCVDAERLERVAHTRIDDKAKQKGNRKECGCFASKDIGEYDTCPHGCVYCYAVQNRELALDRYKEHDPTSPFLFPPKDYVPGQVITVSKASAQREKPRVNEVQQKMFP